MTLVSTTIPGLLSMFQKQVTIACSRVEDVEHKPCPVLGKPGTRDAASCCSKLVFGYAGAVITEGSRKNNNGEGLVEEDLFDLPYANSASTATEKFEELWAVEKRKPKDEQSLTKCLWQMISGQMVICVVLGILQTSFGKTLGHSGDTVVRVTTPYYVRVKFTRQI